ncbi:hypothetical protein DIX60_10610 [Streptococcus iniae]|uniref:hypothetical protein n=1 Tax=Streptococcus iniae TaxID=1346 RepID=UPI000360801E|nr:hypothetical protein [Streptococcus iniae]ESR08821.1 hypothetical protein IUSA1_10215 [Streptococcus iniae IUSA1]RLV26736.1 hypothetical protein DIX60_10610 [Streptococcus iniae]
MNKEIRIRRVPLQVVTQLKDMARKYQYPSLNEFILSQIENIVINDGLNLYQNKFADTLEKIVEQQKEILTNQKRIEINQIALKNKQIIVEELTTNWLHFMDDVDALAAERNAGD